MMAEWTRLILDLVLIGLVSAGVIQATRLIRHLAGLSASRREMERFVHEFGSVVQRAEAGIQALKITARQSGDDLERLVDKSLAVRDELQFIVESADQLANRLTQIANGVRPEPPAEAREAPQAEPAPRQAAETKSPVTSFAQRKEPNSRAEKELMQALKKLS